MATINDKESVWALYSVVVSNVGTVGAYATKTEALCAYYNYVNLSRSNYGRVSGECVILINLNTQEPELEYNP